MTWAELWVLVLQVATLIGGVATLLGFLIAPTLWLGSKIDQIRGDLEHLRKDIASESKDFHGRLRVIEEGRKK